MTIRELEAILKENNVSPDMYSLQIDHPFLRDDAGIYIQKKKDGLLYVVWQNRADLDILGTFKDEHSACMCFLKKIAPYAEGLQKYIE